MTNTKPKTEEKISIGNRVKISPRGKKRTWTAEFWYDGEHRRQSLRTSNKKEAIDRATKLENQLLHGTFRQVQQDVTIAQAVEDYLEHHKTENKARNTLKKYRGQLEPFRDFCHAQRIRFLGRITPSLFDRYRVKRRETVEHNTRSHEGITIKQFLNWCVSRHLIPTNPLAGIKIAKPVVKVRPAPTLAQVQQILAASSPSRRVMFAVLAFTGMRSGELRQLRQEDVDLEGGWFHIVSRENARTKTQSSRKVPMHPLLQNLLRELPASEGPWFFCAEPSGKYPDGDHWINTKKLNEYFLGRVQKVGLTAGRDEGFTIHSLRHFTETHCVNAGIPQRVIDAWLGHKSDRSMAAVYYHLSDEQSQQFMRGLDFAL